MLAHACVGGRELGVPRLLCCLHRITRLLPRPALPRPAGRKGKTGIATTFINKNQSEHILLDLKHLLREAKQRLPPVLQALHDPMEELAVRALASLLIIAH